MKTCVSRMKIPAVRDSASSILRSHNSDLQFKKKVKSTISRLSHESKIHFNLKCGDAAVTCGRDVIDNIGTETQLRRTMNELYAE